MIYRKQNSKERAEPMPKRQFHRICRALKRQGIAVCTGDEADKICKAQNAEAFTLNENTVVFRKNPSRSVVFEELIHLCQYASGKCDGTKLSRIRCEIEAKEKVLRCAQSYGLTKLDIEITKKALESDFRDYKDYYEGGVDSDSLNQEWFVLSVQITALVYVIQVRNETNWSVHVDC